MWLNEILQDLLLGWLGLNFVSLFVSLMAGFAYVKLYPCILGLSKKIGAVHPTQVSPVSSSETEGEINKPVDIGLNDKHDNVEAPGHVTLGSFGHQRNRTTDKSRLRLFYTDDSSSSGDEDDQAASTTEVISIAKKHSIQV